MEQKPEPKKFLLDPNQSDIKVSNKKENKSYIFISKIILNKFGFVELISLGNTCEKSVKIAESLEREEFANIVEFKSEEIVLDEDDNKNRRPTIKLYIKLQKSNKFDKLIEGILK